MKHNSIKIILATLLLMIGFVLGHGVYFKQSMRTNIPFFVPSAKKVSWDNLDRVYQEIKEKYWGPYDKKNLEDKAIQGMVNALGESGGHYYSAEEYRLFKEIDRRKYDSGLELMIVKNQVVIAATPRFGQGFFRAGTVIHSINGRVISNTDLDMARDLLSSNEEKQVELVLYVDSVPVRASLSLTRPAPQELQSSVMNGVITLKPSDLNHGMASKIRQVLKEAVAGNVRGIILDIRNLGPGSFSEGAKIASFFVPKGQPLGYINDTSHQPRAFISESGEFAGVPLAVLVNGDTNLTAEFIAGAMKGQESIKLYGEKTFGEARQFDCIDLPKGEGLRLYSGTYLLPNKTSYQGEGILPNVEVTDDFLRDSLNSIWRKAQEDLSQKM